DHGGQLAFRSEGVLLAYSLPAVLGPPADPAVEDPHAHRLVEFFLDTIAQFGVQLPQSGQSPGGDRLRLARAGRDQPETKGQQRPADGTHTVMHRHSGSFGFKPWMTRFLLEC